MSPAFGGLLSMPLSDTMAERSSRARDRFASCCCGSLERLSSIRLPESLISSNICACEKSDASSLLNGSFWSNKFFFYGAAFFEIFSLFFWRSVSTEAAIRSSRLTSLFFWPLPFSPVSSWRLRLSSWSVTESEEVSLKSSATALSSESKIAFWFALF